MSNSPASRLAGLRVRINVTCAGVLVELNEHDAVVHLRRPQAYDRQTTLTIEGAGGKTLHIPARIVRTEAGTTSAAAASEHQVTLEFLALPRHTAAELRRLVADAQAPALTPA